MTKYGDGLGAEVVKAVRAGKISEPFSTEDVIRLAKEKGWNPSPNYINVILGNSSNLTHSPTYKKYFLRVGTGRYVLSELGKRAAL